MALRKIVCILTSSILCWQMLSSAAAAAAKSQAVPMSFENCLATIRKVSGDLGAAPVNVVETNILRIVRFVTADGSVLVTCSKPDGKMVITNSTN